MAILFGSYGKGVTVAHSDIDLLDISHVDDNSKVQEEIIKTGVLLYEE